MDESFTVGEMIAYLSRFDNDAVVKVRSDSTNDMGTNETITEDSFEVSDDGVIVIRC
ncbi:hypothetical protein S101174_02297 [Levilactobacillus brevis]|nr:hypothetical protein S101174_02297 [Levilactobacillus brevis]